MSRRSRNKRKELKKLKIKKVVDKTKVSLIGFYAGDHFFPISDNEISRYISVKDSKFVGVIASPPIFKTGFVISKYEHSYVIQKGGKKSIKLHVYEVQDEDLSDLFTYYCQNYDLDLETISTVIGDVSVMTSKEEINQPSYIVDQDMYKYHSEKIEKLMLTKFLT